jgi:mannose-6-phosphate isomerase-like protein (cupin superfamily)
MKITNYKNVQTKKNPHGVDVRKIHENDDVQVIHLLLKPGEKLKPHKTPVNVFFYVVEGTGIVEVGEEKKTVSVDDIVDSPKDIPHCLYNESENNFRVLVVKTPNPTNTQG